MENQIKISTCAVQDYDDYIRTEIHSDGFVPSVKNEIH